VNVNSPIDARHPAGRVTSSPYPALRSVGALIHDAQGRVLLQRRDRKTSIYFPGLWGVFGGSCEGAETPEHAILREIREELSLEVARAELFLEWNIKSRDLGVEPRERFFFSVAFDAAMVAGIKLREGAEYRFFAVDDLPPVKSIVPFDLAALCMFCHARLLGSQITPQPSGRP
jgi:8-oxo-dGTP pyrophosphatase MutT (NUDIX family)